MKHIQVIDGAVNCSYSIYQISDEAFSLIFPGNEQDVEFIEDAADRLGEQRISELLEPAWKRRIEKHHVAGIHGTLFYGCEFKKKFYPHKRESDFDNAEYQKWILNKL